MFPVFFTCFSHCSRSFCSAAGTYGISCWDPLASLTFRHPILVLLEKCKSRDQFKQILAQMIRIHLTTEVFPMSRLLHFSAIARPENIDIAITLFKHCTPQPNLYIYNIMISALSLSEQSFYVYKSMLQSSLYPDRQTFLSLLHAAKCISEGKQIHGHAVVTGFLSESYIQNSLIKMYLDKAHLTHAQQVFEQIANPDTVSWNIMISGFSKKGWCVEALELFCRMVSFGGEPDEYTIVSLLVACSKLGDSHRGKSVHALIEKRRLSSASNLIVGNALLDFYVKCQQLEIAQRVFYQLEKRDVISWNTMTAGLAKLGKLEDAQNLFSKMPCRDLVSWNSLISGYAQNSDRRAARELFSTMISGNVNPDTVTITSLVSCAAETGDLSQGRWIHGWLVRNQAELNAFAGSALIDMYCKCGCIPRAFTVFETLEERDVTVWTAMIAGLAFHGRGYKAFEIFNEMQDHLVPNTVTFVAMLSACCHSGMVDQGLQIFNSMRQKYGINPGVEHYGCLIDLLGRSGRLLEAKAAIDNMPMRPSRSIWGSMLSACNAHGNLELAGVALRELREVEPDKAGGYVLMSNLYAAGGKWKYSNIIREMMENRRLKKTVGCSWIVVGGIVNDFVAFDSRHSRRLEIYYLLDSLNKEMRSITDISC